MMRILQKINRIKIGCCDTKGLAVKLVLYILSGGRCGGWHEEELPDPPAVRHREGLKALIVTNMEVPVGFVVIRALRINSVNIVESSFDLDYLKDMRNLKKGNLSLLNDPIYIILMQIFFKLRNICLKKKQ